MLTRHLYSLDSMILLKTPSCGSSNSSLGTCSFGQSRSLLNGSLSLCSGVTLSPTRTSTTAGPPVLLAFSSKSPTSSPNFRGSHESNFTSQKASLLQASHSVYLLLWHTPSFRGLSRSISRDISFYGSHQSSSFLLCFLS